ncbi:hypothetical protein FDECE_718 [Fusarium decemcellulare]|nr:hypothetical protein FDECE_718 [Fusarium decemcellulare]
MSHSPKPSERSQIGNASDQNERRCANALLAENEDESRNVDKPTHKTPVSISPPAHVNTDVQTIRCFRLYTKFWPDVYDSPTLSSPNSTPFKLQPPQRPDLEELICGSDGYDMHRLHDRFIDDGVTVSLVYVNGHLEKLFVGYTDNVAHDRERTHLGLRLCWRKILGWSRFALYGSDMTLLEYFELCFDLEVAAFRGVELPSPDAVRIR